MKRRRLKKWVKFMIMFVIVELLLLGAYTTNSEILSAVLIIMAMMAIDRGIEWVF